MDRRDVLEDMLLLPGTDCEFVVARPDEDVGNEGRTLSAEAIDELRDNLIMWVATRMSRHWEETHEPPRRIVVNVRVEVD